MIITFDLVTIFVMLYAICAICTGVSYMFKILKAESKGEAIGSAIGIVIVTIATCLLVKAYL